MRHALKTLFNLFGEEHASTADSYDALVLTQLCLDDWEGALESAKHIPHLAIELGDKQAGPDETETYGLVILHHTAPLGW